ncbi:ATP-binding protein [Faecalibacillus intestinalis]|nr:AAA family ATPase [Faecalibacillus intestinalis]
MKKIYFREKYLKKMRGFYHDTEMIKVITGVHRCGKSTLLEMIAEELLKDDVKKENIVFIHLDKRPYSRVSKPEVLEEIIDSKTKLINGTKYLFIDEVQNVKDFERVVNSFREERDFSIFITGSNSYLLSGELVTKLTGRYIDFPMTTLTFDEYIGMKKYLDLEVNPNIDQELISYILEGGFPLTLQYHSS